jgi:hypothetical protein
MSVNWGFGADNKARNPQLHIVPNINAKFKKTIKHD